jgi:hypothetical protein
MTPLALEGQHVVMKGDLNLLGIHARVVSYAMTDPNIPYSNEEDHGKEKNTQKETGRSHISCRS